MDLVVHLIIINVFFGYAGQCCLNLDARNKGVWGSVSYEQGHDAATAANIQNPVSWCRLYMVAEDERVYGISIPVFRLKEFELAA